MKSFITWRIMKLKIYLIIAACLLPNLSRAADLDELLSDLETIYSYEKCDSQKLCDRVTEVRLEAMESFVSFVDALALPYDFEYDQGLWAMEIATDICQASMKEDQIDELINWQNQTMARLVTVQKEAGLSPAFSCTFGKKEIVDEEDGIDEGEGFDESQD